MAQGQNYVARNEDRIQYSVLIYLAGLLIFRPCRCSLFSRIYDFYKRNNLICEMRNGNTKIKHLQRFKYLRTENRKMKNQNHHMYRNNEYNLQKVKQSFKKKKNLFESEKKGLKCYLIAVLLPVYE